MDAVGECPFADVGAEVFASLFDAGVDFRVLDSSLVGNQDGEEAGKGGGVHDGISRKAAVGFAEVEVVGGHAVSPEAGSIAAFGDGDGVFLERFECVWVFGENRAVRAPVVLREGDKYGVLLLNDSKDRGSSPRYILAMAENRTLIDTKNLEFFRLILTQLPKGSVIYPYDTASVSASWGINGDEYQSYLKAIADAGLVLSDQLRLTSQGKK